MAHINSPPVGSYEVREFRLNKRLWAVVFVLFAGPFNPAGWYLGWPNEGYFFLKDIPSLAFIALFPTTVIATFMLHRMWRAKTFIMGDLWWWASIGYFIALFAGPLGFILADIFEHGFDPSDLGNIVKGYFLTLFFGWVLGIIPYFATFIGLPCALVAMMGAYACTKPVDPAK